jgi:hypothetical protein
MRTGPCIIAALVCAPIYADVIFSNLTTPAQDGGVTICGTSTTDCSGSQTVAAAFTPTSDYSITEVQVQVFAFDPDASAALNVFLYSDSGGLPGTEIAELASDITAPFSGGPNIIDLGTPVDVMSSTEYWLVLAGADANSVAYWDIGGSSSVPSAVSLNGGAFQTDLTQPQQFEIDGTPLSTVPEPRAVWLVPLALVCAAFRFRKRRALSPQTTAAG